VRAAAPIGSADATRADQRQQPSVGGEQAALEFGKFEVAAHEGGGAAREIVKERWRRPNCHPLVPRFGDARAQVVGEQQGCLERFDLEFVLQGGAKGLEGAQRM
jgi:hypothetical protein